MKKKVEKIGVITGLDLIKKTNPKIDIPFKTGGHATKKDKPREKVNRHNIDKYLQRGKKKMMVYVVTYEDKKNNEFDVLGVHSTEEFAEARIKSEMEWYRNYDYTEDELKEIEKNYNWYCVPQGK